MSIFNLLAGYNYDIRSAVQALVAVVGGGGGGGASTGTIVTTPAGTQIFNSRSLVGTASGSQSLIEVGHRWWGKFMNDHAVWIPGGGGGNQSIDLNITVNFPGTGLYRFAYGGDDTGFIQIDGVQVITGGGNIFSVDGGLYDINVTEGNRVLRCYVRDTAGPPSGFALTITSLSAFSKAPGGGGGGGGQVVTASPAITPQVTYNIVIGSGGAASTSGTAGGSGSSSSLSGSDITTITALGGIGGGASTTVRGGNGGASGGSLFAGGTGSSTGALYGGGGGGSGGTGVAGASSSQPAGGSGVTPSYSVNTLGTGGAGGLGNGGSQVNGTANRGIGGQGGGVGYNGGAGGSGTVLISTTPSYFLSYTAAVPSAVAKTTYASRDVYTFTASTSIIFSSTIVLTGFAVTPSTITFGDAAPTITVPSSNYPAGSIQYSSSNPAVATINQTTGAITVVGGGIATLAASMIVESPYVSSTVFSTLNINKYNSHAVTLSLSKASINLGASITINSSITGQISPAPSGNILIKSNGTQIGTLVASAGGSISYTPTGAGGYTISADYAGNVNYTAKTAAGKTLSVADNRYTIWKGSTGTVGLNNNSTTAFGKGFGLSETRSIAKTINISGFTGFPDTNVAFFIDVDMDGGFSGNNQPSARIYLRKGTAFTGTEFRVSTNRKYSRYSFAYDGANIFTINAKLGGDSSDNNNVSAAIRRIQYIGGSTTSRYVLLYVLEDNFATYNANYGNLDSVVTP